MSMSSHDQGPRGPNQKGDDRTEPGRERKGMHTEDDRLVAKPVSRQDEMMRVAIAGFLGLFVVSMALAQSRPSPEPVPEPQLAPAALAEFPPPLPPQVAEFLPPPPPPVAPIAAAGDNRLYGRVVTTRGREYEGYIRWDRNEGSWADLLDANKRTSSRSFDRRADLDDLRLRDEDRGLQDAERELRDQARRLRDEERRIRDEERRIRDEERRLLDEEGRDGDEERRLLDEERRQLDEARRDLDEQRRLLDEERRDRDDERRIRFGRHDRRIQVRGVRIAWRDNDLSSSVSSGIRFGHISRIEALNNRSALVSLRSGEEVQLDGNATDLGSGLRRLEVVDVEQGQVELKWRDIDVIEFMDAPVGDREQARDESLYGTMTTSSGTEFTGYVSWDVDEIFHSDILDGEDRGIDREIRFGDVSVIARNSSGSARVTLQDGEELVLRGTNDVDSSNNGISVSDPALGQVKVDWDEFAELRFHEPENHTGRDAFDGGHRLYGTVTSLDGDEVTGYVLWDNDKAYSWEMLNGSDDDVEFHVEFGQIESVQHRSHRGATVTLLDGRTLQLSDSNDVSDGNRGIVVTNDDGDSTRVSWDNFEQVRFHSP